ncbi:hypothetical protein ABW636_18010 [Aquimarina sp. 2201CG1-2-11]|uniref:hypothetical protein n=1 Tax=Aquimarina discodermiae TaxID=3231043 RepID=UPI003461EE2E
MKTYVLIFLLITGNVFSQKIDTLKKEALRDAKATTQASLDKDPNVLVKYTHPKIIKKFGKDQMVDTMKDIFRTMTAQKIKIVSSEVNEVTEIKKENKEYRCLIKTTVQMDFNGRQITIKSSLFGFYDKKKSQWYFVESNKLLNDPETQALFPKFKTEIQIPEDEHISEN